MIAIASRANNRQTVYMHRPMILRSVSLTPEQLDAAKDAATAAGVSFSEIMRRALAAYLKQRGWEWENHT